MGLGQLIRFSPKRSSLFETLQQQFSPGAPSLKTLCPTRWTVRTGANEAVLAYLLRLVLTIPVTTATAERTFLLYGG